MPSQSPLTASDSRNMWYCGTTLQHAETCSSQWCRSTYSSDCPQGQSCYQTDNCNATSFNYTNMPSTIAPSTPVPSVSPSTDKPTMNLNPKDWYCSNDGWRDGTYEGDCGVPCPR